MISLARYPLAAQKPQAEQWGQDAALIWAMEGWGKEAWAHKPSKSTISYKPEGFLSLALLSSC